MVAENYMVLYHVAGCNGPAIQVRKDAYNMGKPVRSEDCRHLNGRKIDPLSECRCDSCGGEMNPGRLRAKPRDK